MTDKPGNNDDWRDDTVSRAYGELKKAEPSADLDRKILAEAHRAVATEDKTVVRVHRWRKWSVPAALAATVVFAVPLVVRVFDNVDAPGQVPAIATTQTAETRDEPVPAAPAAGRIDANALMDPDTPPAGNGFAASPPPAEKTGESEALRYLASVPVAAAPVAGEGEDRDGIATYSRLNRLADEGPAPVEETMGISELRRFKPTAASREETATTEAPADAPVPATAAQLPEAPDSLKRESLAMEPGFEEIVVTGSRVSPEAELIEIARLHQRGRVRQARRQLGEFLVLHPGYELPDYFPLDAGDAIYPTDASGQRIVPEADDWLRGIAAMVERGDSDGARMQLAEFLERYPDHPLPDDFPLRRQDASIER